MTGASLPDWLWRAAAPRRRARAARPARPAALPAQGQARHLPVPVGRAVADRAVRLQAAAGRVPGDGASRLDPQRPAAHRHVGVAVDLPGRAVEVRLRSAGPVGRMGERPAAAHRQDRRPAGVREVGPHRGDQPRSGGHHDPDGLPSRRPAEPRRVGLVRDRLRDRGPAGVLRDDLELAAAASRSTTGCGAAPSCRAGTRA